MTRTGDPPMNWTSTFFILHAPDSARTIKEFVRIVIQGYEASNLVLTRVQGSATQGIEQASKDCFKAGKNLLVLSDLDDMKELVALDAIYLFPPPQFATGTLDVQRVAAEMREGKKVAFVFGGGKVSGLTRKELQAGEPVKVIERDAGPLATCAILLHELDRASP